MKHVSGVMVFFLIILGASALNPNLSDESFIGMTSAVAADKSGAGIVTPQASGTTSAKIWTQPTEYYATKPFVDLVSFTATLSSDGSTILVEWETSKEVRNVGFYVLRSESKIGGYVRLNDTIIPSEGGNTWGGAYLYEDTDFNPDTSYWYSLEAVDEWRLAYIHGPVLLGGGGDEADSDSDSCFIRMITR